MTMAPHDVSAGAGHAHRMLHPDSPLRSYAPGNLARLNPHERGQVLKGKKRVLPNPALTSSRTVLRR